MGCEKALSVIIVSYENMEVLSDCLNSIARFNDIGDEAEVIVVEQSRSEGIYQRLISDYPWVKTIRNKNRGFGAGNNAGAGVANGKLLLFLNPDTILIEPVFRYAVDIYKNNPMLGMFGFRLLDSIGGKNKSFHFRKPYGIARSIIWRMCDAFDIYLPQSMYIAGADMFVPAAAFQAAGGFNESMFMYFEETYLCVRLNSIGYRTRYFPQKHIIHLEGRSSSTVNTLKRQIESLRVLYGGNKKEFGDCLRKMRRDRRVKSFFQKRRLFCLREIELIESQLSECCDSNE